MQWMDLLIAYVMVPLLPSSVAWSGLVWASLVECIDLWGLGGCVLKKVTLISENGGTSEYQTIRRHYIY